MRTPIRVLFPVVTVCLICLAAIGQDSIEIIRDRIQRAEYFESGDAVVLLDAGEVTVHPDGTFEYIGHEQILLRTWDAVDAYGQVELTYTDTLESLEIVYGRTILPAGETVDVETSDIVFSRYSEGGESEAYGALKIMRLNMPALSPGAVIDYCYRLTITTPTFENEYYDYWYFEWWDPVLESEFVVDAPTEMELSWCVQKRTLDPEIQTSPERVRYAFHADKVEPLSGEPGMPSDAAIESSVTLSSVDSWEAVSAWWWNLGSDEWAEGPEIASQAEALTEACTTDEERIAALYDFVAREVRYVGLGLGTSGYEPRAASETLATRYGDCKDQTSLLLALLHAVGIEAYPLLVSTADGFRLDWSMPPTPIAFNHAIVAIPEPDGEWLFLDPTCSLCTVDRGGSLLWEHDGLLVVPDPGRFEVRVAIPSGDPAENLVRCSLQGSLSESNALTLKADIECRGDSDIAMRDLFLYYAPDGQGDLCAALVDYSLPQAVLLTYTYSDPEDLDVPFRYLVDYRKSRAVRWLSGGTGLLPLPYGASIPLPGDYTEFLYPEQRTYPLICYSERIELSADIDVGGAQIAELPQDVRIENAVGNFHASYSHDGSVIRYERALQIDVVRVEPEDFHLFCDLIRAMREDEEAVAVLRND